MAEGNRIIPGCATIHFDEITKKRIYEAIYAANFNDVHLIKANYQNLKYKLERIPTLMDFEEYGEIDVLTMHCYLCTLQNDNFTLIEHEAARWLTKDTLDTVDWLPADAEAVEKLRMNVQ